MTLLTPEQLQLEIKRLRAALEYYADPKTYAGFALGYEWVTPIELDAGKTARKALSQEETP